MQDVYSINSTCNICEVTFLSNRTFHKFSSTYEKVRLLYVLRGHRL